MKNIQVLELRLLPPGKPIRAFADIQVGNWTIRDFRVIKQSGQKAFVCSPQVSWKDTETGEIRYQSILTLPPEQKQAIDIEILRAYQVATEQKNERPE